MQDINPITTMPTRARLLGDHFLNNLADLSRTGVVLQRPLSRTGVLLQSPLSATDHNL